jgi:predicted ATP-grasp superfamily ATP-dependent carboligase
VLVCDGEQRSALAVVRSLGRRGHQVAVCSHERRPLAGASKWARRVFHVPSPGISSSAYVAALRSAAAEWRPDVILPVTDQSNLATLGSRDELAPAIIPGPTLEAFVAVSDKHRVLTSARQLGIATPEQIVVENPSSIDLAQMRGPYAIKSASGLHGAKRYPVLYAQEEDDLRQQVSMAPLESFPLLVQRRIIGSGVGIFLLLHDGQAVATFAHERIREHPPSGGASVYCRSAPVPPDLLRDSVSLLNAHGWTGAAMVEFKRETATGVHYLMEVNGRFWGSLQLAVDAGVDFPALVVDLANGSLPQPVSTYEVGLSLRSLWGDIDNTLVRLRHSPATLDLPPGSGGRLAALARFLRWSPRENFEILRLSDPAPFFVASLRYLRVRLNRD